MSLSSEAIRALHDAAVVLPHWRCLRPSPDSPAAYNLVCGVAVLEADTECWRCGGKRHE